MTALSLCSQCHSLGTTLVSLKHMFLKGGLLFLSTNAKQDGIFPAAQKGTKITDFGFTHFSVYSCDEITGTHNLTEVGQIGLRYLERKVKCKKGIGYKTCIYSDMYTAADMISRKENTADRCVMQ